MSVVIRLARAGAKKKICYRIVAATSEKARDGRFLEILGTYNPQKKEGDFSVKEEKVMKWLANGAQPSETVKNILKKAGVWKKFKNKSEGEPASFETV